MFPIQSAPLPETSRDRGVVDVSIEMLFGLLAALFVVLLLFETTTYWHARNVYDDAAAEGARVAAAFDGSCAAGAAAARTLLAAHGGGWVAEAKISCSEGPMVAVTVSGPTPGVLSGALGFAARVTETAPKEG